MLTTDENLVQLVAARASGDDARTALLVAGADDVDAVCATRVWTMLLQDLAVTYKVQPVYGWSDVAQCWASAKGKHHSVVFLNCGGVEDLETKLNPSNDELIIVLDSHRPLHHANIASTKVLVAASNELPEDFEDVLILEQDGMIPSETDLEFLENVGDGDHSDASDDDDDDDDDDENTQESQSSRRRKRARTREDERMHRVVRREAYYAPGTYRSTTSATWLSSLAGGERGTAEEKSFRLWLCSIALMDALMREEISQASYDDVAAKIASRARDYNAYSRGAMDVDVGGPAEQGELNDDNSRSVSVGVNERNRLEKSTELRLCLLRHSSLMDAFLYSEFSSSRYQTWKKKGRAKVEDLFARAGISLNEAKADFDFLEPEFKSSLVSLISQHLKEGKDSHVASKHTHITKWTLTSFQCQVSFAEKQLSSSDSVLAIQAALSESSFERAYDFSSPKALTNFVEEACSSARRFQKQCYDEMVRAIEEDRVRTTGDFRLVELPKADGPSFLSTETRGGCYNSLIKVAQWIRDAMALEKKWKTPRPLLLACPCADDTTTLVGVNAFDHDSEISKNNFSVKFEKAARLARCAYTHDSFHRNLVRVASSDCTHFVVALAEVMAT